MSTAETTDACITETPDGRTYWEFVDGRWVLNDEATWHLNRALERRDPWLVDMIERAEEDLKRPSLDLASLSPEDFERWLRGEYPGDWGSFCITGLSREDLLRVMFRNHR